MGALGRVEYLIVDTSAFIRNAAIQDIGTNVITAQDVVREITNKRQLRRLVVLPYDLIIKDVFPENVQFVTEFAKKTGDYLSLSATDIKVIALTYQLEKEKVGIDHLNSVPALSVTVNVGAQTPNDRPHDVAGFFLPHDDASNCGDKTASKDPRCTEEVVDKCEFDVDKQSSSESERLSECSSVSDYDTANSDLENTEANSLANRFSVLQCKPEDLRIEDDRDVSDVLKPTKNTEDLNEDEYEDDNEDQVTDPEDSCDDDEGWITPGNIVKAKKQMGSDFGEEKRAVVACLTTDFAMQNVLKQIGLQVVSMDGRVIRQLRTFILRCYACFKTTSIMTKEFCPRCGNKTLKKVAVSLDENGCQRVHINFKKPLTPRGKKFSIPTPRGGKHANNPILFEDQPRPDERPTRLARTKNDPLNDDYTAGYSPFIMRDINSKSAMLGIRSGVDVKHWMRKNPNQARRKGK